jgi:phage terminase large subunit-like protein
MVSIKAKSLQQICRMIPGGYDPFETAGDCKFDKKLAQRALDFFAEHLVFIEGDKAGQPFALEDWQKAIVANLFGWIDKKGNRRFRESFIFVPRKNGKTPLCAGIIDYVGFCDNEPGAQIYSAAGEREQATLVFRHAAGMIVRNPILDGMAKIYKTFKSIEFKGGDTVFKALSSEAETKHGYNSHLVIVDELHVQPNRDLVDALTTSTSSRRQPMIIHITTAGWDRHSICFEKYDYAIKVRDGIIKDSSFLPVIYETLEDEDWKSEAVWRKSNPNLGVSVSLEYLKKECKRAQEIPAYENTFRRLHLNQWTQQDVRWLPMDRWNLCGGKKLTLEDFAGQPCYGGLDLSSTTDLTVFSLIFQDQEDYHVFTFPFIPAANAKKRMDRDRVPYLTWAKEGYLEMTPGDSVDYDRIRKRIGEIGQIVDIRGIAIDRWNATQISAQLEGDGFNVVLFGQGYASMSAPSKKFEELILSQSIHHGDHPVLTWCASNVMAETDAAECIKPSKKKSSERIDAVVATLMALGLCIATPLDKGSVYDNADGVLVL